MKFLTWKRLVRTYLAVSSWSARLTRGVGVLQQGGDPMECVLQVEKEGDRLALTSQHFMSYPCPSKGWHTSALPPARSETRNRCLWMCLVLSCHGRLSQRNTVILGALTLSPSIQGTFGSLWILSKLGPLSCSFKTRKATLYTWYLQTWYLPDLHYPGG